MVIVAAGCSNCSQSCTAGITFDVSALAGSLGRGTEEPLTVCFDGTCRAVTVSRENVGGTVFLPFSGVNRTGDHDLTVTGSGAFKGEYHGPIVSYSQKSSCSICALATVKIAADGALTPGVPVAPTVTTTIAGSPPNS